MKTLDLSYAAGFFDGEGYVGMHRCKPSGRGVSLRYYIRCSIENTYLPILEQFHQRWGGSLRPRPSRENRGSRPSWIWAVSSQIAAAFLEDIIPYLHEKRAAAELSIEAVYAFSSRQGGLPLTEEELALREGYYRTLRRTAV